MAAKLLRDIITIRGGFVRAVRLKDDFFDEGLNKRKLESYLINPSARDAFYSISKGLHPTSKHRTHLISGTYGSGKSHFGLVMANYFARNSNDKDMEMIFRRLKQKDPSKASEIYNIRNEKRPYLLVLLEGYDPDGIDHALLKGLRDALSDPKRGGLPEEMLESSYQTALHKIEEWEKDKSDFYNELESLLGSSKKGNIDKLKHGLGDFKPESYATFKQLHQQITTSPFVSLFGENATDAYLKTSELLIKKHGYKGIVVIWDEFYAHLSNTLPALLGREQETLRKFAEKCEISGETQIHLILISHNLPHSYIQERISKESLDGWMTVEGRFKQCVLTAIEEAEELITLAITKDQSDQKWHQVEKNLKNQTSWLDRLEELDLYPDKGRDWLWENVCRDGYPLHPATTFCLPLISDVVGQAERTMFTFFEEEINAGGLARFVNETPIFRGKQLNLYTADRLFDFFKRAIEGTPDTREIVAKYTEAINRLRDKSASLTLEILKALAIIEGIRAKHPMALAGTLLNLCWIIDASEEEVGPLLDSLKQNEILWEGGNGEYLFRSGRMTSDFGKDFKAAKSSIQWANPILKLKQRYPKEDIPAREYGREFKLTRRLKVVYVSADSLNNIAQYERQISDNYLDGFALYVVAEDEKDVEEARKKAINVKNSQILVAIPKERLDIFDAMKNSEALEMLGEKSQYNIYGSEGYRICQEKLTAEQKKLAKEIRRWQKVSALDWFWKGRTLDIEGQQEHEIASHVMFAVYDKTPTVEHERMANRWTQDQKKDRVQLNTAILDKRSGSIRYETKGNPAGKTILKQTFEPQGMLRLDRTKGNYEYFELVEPTKEPTKEIWALMEKSLLNKHAHLEFGKLVRNLQLPPYGLSPRVVELFLSAFFRFHRDNFTLQMRRTTSSPWEKREFDGQTIYEIVNLQQDKVLVGYRELPPLAEDFILDVNSIISPDKMWDYKLSPTDGVGTLLVEWYNNLPPVTRNGRELSKESKGFLKKLGTPTEEDDMKNLLFEKVPAAVGIEKKFEAWQKKDLEHFHDGLNEIIAEINNYHDKVVSRALSIFRSVFSVSGSTEYDVMATIRNWYNSLSPSVREHKFTGNAHRLLKYANISTMEQFTDRFLIECSRDFNLEEYTKWEDEDVVLKKYEGMLRKAKIEIETIQRKKGTKQKDKDRGKKLSKKALSLKKTIHNTISLSGKGLSNDEIIRVLEEIIEELRK